MADLRVKLILDLINRLSGPARAARGDLKGVGTEARALSKEKIGDQMARDLDRTRASAARTAQELRRLKSALRETARQATAIPPILPAGPGAVAGKGAAAGAMLAAGKRALLPLGVAAGGYAGARGTIGQSISFEKSMAEVKKKVDLPEGGSFAALEREISSMAIAMGRSREDIAAVVAEAGAAGVAFNDLTGFTRLATKASVAWDMSSREAAQKLFEIRAATGKTLAELEDFGDMVNMLGDNSAAKERDILEMFNRAGSAAKAAGSDIQTSLAFLTAMRSVGIGEEVGARAFADLTATLATATKDKKVAKGLKEIGIEAKSMEKSMRTNAAKGLLDLFAALEKSKDPIGSAVNIFGKEWFDEALRTGGAIKEVKKNLDLLLDPSKRKGSMDKSLNIELATTASHLKQLSSLASQVGDRLGRWALPAINEGIERILAGMKALNAAADQRKAAKDVAEKESTGVVPSAEERQRIASDSMFAEQVEAERRRARREADTTTDSDLRRAEIRGDRIDPQQAKAFEARIERLTAERDKIAATIEAMRARNNRSASASAAVPAAIADLEKKQMAIDEQVAALKSQIDRKIDPRRPADQEERGRADRGEVLALQTRISQIEARIRAFDGQSSKASNPATRNAYAGDADAERRRLGPVVSNKFGFGPGGSPAGQKPTGPGPGLLSFGTGGGKAIKDAFTVDLGAAGMTMAEQLANGFRSGQGQIEGAADASGQAVRGKLASVDLTGAGQQIMQSFANGIRAGGEQAVREAQSVAARVKAAAASGSGARGGLAGSLHDGIPT